MLAKYFGGELYYSPIEIVKRKKPIWAFEVKIGEITKAEMIEGVKRLAL